MNGADLSFEGLNIHKIRFGKKEIKDRKTCKSLISTIVPTASSDRPTFSDQTEFYTYRKAVHWDPGSNLGFHIRLYYLKHPTRSSFAEWMAATTGSQTDDFAGVVVHLVCFLFRELKIQKTSESVSQQWEIFALTQGDGWRVVKSYADYYFPLRIAAKLISPQFSVVETKSLVGDKHSSQETYRREYSLEQHELDSMWKVFLSFRSSFKEGTSLYNPEYKLSAFTASKVKRKSEKKAVKIGSGKIAITGKMTFLQHVEILDHFSRVYRGDSYRIDGNGNRLLEEDDLTWRYLENIRLVDHSLVPQLSQALLVVLWYCHVRKEYKSHLSFVHRYYRDFYASSEFILIVSSSKRCSWPYPPLIEDVMESFRALAGPFSNMQEFCQKVARAQFKFNRQKKNFPLKEFLQGEIRYEGSAFFHVDGKWLEVDKNHLAVIQRSFRTLLSNHLLIDGTTPVDKTTHPKGPLTEPWFAQSQWVAFELDEMKEATGASAEEIRQILEELLKKKFSFIDENGRVSCPYPTHCLLRDQNPDCRSIKPILRKNWEQLEVILKEKEGDVISEADVAILFPKHIKIEKPSEDVGGEQQSSAGEKNNETSGEEQNTKKLLKILKEKRSVMVRKQLFEAKKSPVASTQSAFDEQGIPVITDLSTYTFTGRTITKHQAVIEVFLKEKQNVREAVSTSNLKERINAQQGVKKIRNNDVKAVMKALKTLPSLAQQPKDSYLYSIQGPIPEDFDCKNAKVLEFLKGKHSNYRRILQEEGYNRLYLEKEGFLIFDQVYPGAGEKVELFDIFQYDTTNPKGDLYLYHVKEGFGQKTREACSQIRVSAGLLRNAIDLKNQTLHRLYDQATSGDVISPFRKKLKEKLEKLGSTPKAGKSSSDRFVSLFTEAGKIWYVYAFIDDAETERRLETEQKPNLKLLSDDLSTLIPDAVRRGAILEHLKNHKLLDRDNRLTDDFFRLTKEQFYDKMKELEEKDLIFSCVNGKVSQFESLIAKVELLHLRDFLQGLGFGFLVYQIPRNDKHSFQQAVGQVNEPYEFTQDEWNCVPPHNQFDYKGKKYEYSDRARDSYRNLVAYLINPNSRINIHNLHLEIFKLFKNNNQKIKQKNFKKYLSDLLNVGFVIKRTDLVNVASCLDYKIIILKENNAKAGILNAKGKKEVFFFKKGTAYHVARMIEKDSEKESQVSIQGFIAVGTKDYPYSEELPEDLQGEILSQPCPNRVGMINQNNDCFFNSAFQFIIHSPLQEFFLDQGYLEKNVDGSFKESSLKFYKFFKELSLAYHFSGEGADKATRYSRSEMRRLLNLPSNGQQDADEALEKIFAFYNLSGILSTMSSTTKRFGPLLAISESETDEDVEPLIDQQRPLETMHLNIIDLTPSKDKDESFQSIFDNQIPQVKIDEPQNLFVEVNGVQRQASRIEYHREITEHKDNICFRINRYETRLNEDGSTVMIYNPVTKQQEAVIEKLDRNLTLDNFEIKIDESDFELQGFICHLGAGPNSGHYITYCRTEGGWRKYNDTTVEEFKNEQPSELEVIKQAAQKAYILHFKRKEDAIV